MLQQVDDWFTTNIWFFYIISIPLCMYVQNAYSTVLILYRILLTHPNFSFERKYNCITDNLLMNRIW